jgi:hypothetical protein
MVATARAHRHRDERSFPLQRAQPAMTGLIEARRKIAHAAARTGEDLSIH